MAKGAGKPCTRGPQVGLQLERGAMLGNLLGEWVVRLASHGAQRRGSAHAAHVNDWRGLAPTMGESLEGEGGAHAREEKRVKKKKSMGGSLLHWA